MFFSPMCSQTPHFPSETQVRLLRSYGTPDSAHTRVPAPVGGSPERDDLHQLSLVGQHLRERGTPGSFTERDRYRAPDGTYHGGHRPSDGPDVRRAATVRDRIGTAARGAGSRGADARRD